MGAGTCGKNDKKQIVLGLETTGRCWFALAVWMISNGISVVRVNPYAVKQSKEAGILAKIGDASRLDDVKEIQKLSGMGLAACSSGKHKGQTKISRRGRKRLRYWLFQAAKSAVSHADEYKQLYEYYKTRTSNPLKKMQPLIVTACKILRVIYTILKTGTAYGPQKLLKDIRHPASAQAPLAA